MFLKSLKLQISYPHKGLHAYRKCSSAAKGLSLRLSHSRRSRSICSPCSTPIWALTSSGSDSQQALTTLFHVAIDCTLPFSRLRACMKADLILSRYSVTYTIFHEGLRGRVRNAGEPSVNDVERSPTPGEGLCSLLLALAISWSRRGLVFPWCLNQSRNC